MSCAQIGFHNEDNLLWITVNKDINVTECISIIPDNEIQKMKEYVKKMPLRKYIIQAIKTGELYHASNLQNTLKNNKLDWLDSMLIIPVAIKSNQNN